MHQSGYDAKRSSSICGSKRNGINQPQNCVTLNKTVPSGVPARKVVLQHCSPPFKFIMNWICAVHTVARKDIVKNTPLIITRNIAQHSITPATKVIVYNTLSRFAETKTNLNHKDCKLIKVNCKVQYLMLCVCYLQLSSPKLLTIVSTANSPTVGKDSPPVHNPTLSFLLELKTRTILILVFNISPITLQKLLTYQPWLTLAVKVALQDSNASKILGWLKRSDASQHENACCN